jgi:probable HAF family extracellular repeat protein
MFRLSLFLGVSALIAVPAALHAASISYTITPIAPLVGDNYSSAYAVNNSGQVAGISDNFTLMTPPDGVAAEFLTSSSGILLSGSTTTAIPTFVTTGQAPAVSTPVAINDSGEVVGYATALTSNTAFIYKGGALINLGATVGGALSQANAVNNSGQVAGSFDAVIGDGINQGFLFNGAVQHLATTGEPFGGAAAINAAGVAAGAVAPAGEDFHAATFTGATSHEIGTLPGLNLSAAFAINSAGNIAGWSGNAVFTPDFVLLGAPPADQSQFAVGLNPNALEIFDDSQFESGDAFFYNASTQKLADLGNLGGTFSAAFGINDSGDIVGTSLTANDGYHAFIDNGSTMVDLNSLLPPNSGWTLIAANDINNNGEIVGFGQNQGNFEGFILAPATGNGAVPLPPAAASGLIFLTGLALISKFKSRLTHSA